MKLRYNSPAVLSYALLSVAVLVVDFLFRITAAVTRGFHHIGALTQTGRLRWYAANMAIGLIVVVLIVASV